MRKSKKATKEHASPHNNRADYFASSPLNETSDHLEAVLKRVNRLCNFYTARRSAADEFAEWTPSLVELDKGLHQAMKVLSKWEFKVKLEELKKNTKIELAETWDPFGDYELI